MNTSQARGRIAASLRLVAAVALLSAQPALAKVQRPTQPAEANADVSDLYQKFNKMADSVDSGFSKPGFGSAFRDYKQGVFYLYNEGDTRKSVEAAGQLKTLTDYAARLDAAIGQAMGPEVAALVGDGARNDGRGLKDGAMALAKQMIDACHDANSVSNTASESDLKEFNAKYQAYRQKVAELTKLDRRAIGYTKYNDQTQSNFLADLFECEDSLADRREGLEDVLPRADGVSFETKGCGRMGVLFEKYMLPDNSWTDWRAITMSYSNKGQPFDCAEFPKSPKPLPAEIQAKLNDLIPREDYDLISAEGEMRKEQQVEKENFNEAVVFHKRTYTRQDAYYYKKDMPLAGSPCGPSKVRLACEAAGSNTARAYNHLEHALRRAEYHRKKGNAQRCQEFVGEAQTALKEWKEKYKEMKGSGRWVAGLTYLTYKSGTMDEKAILAKLEDMGKKTEGIFAETWCAGP